jgi:hypothetical protein
LLVSAFNASSNSGAAAMRLDGMGEFICHVNLPFSGSVIAMTRVFAPSFIIALDTLEHKSAHHSLNDSGGA